jgi:hypothetical protein
VSLRSAAVLVLFPILCILTISSCGTVAAVRPLPRGKSALGVSLGGPVASISGMNIPMPYAVARYRYGLSDRSSLYVGGHLTAAALGVVGIDAGGSYHFLAQNRWWPALGASLGLVALVEPGGGNAVFPQLDLVGSYLHGSRFLTYFGAQSLYQFEDRPYVVFAPFVGEEVRLASRLSFSLEAKWYAPTEKTKPRNVNYQIPVGGKGGVGFVFGLNYNFGGWYGGE